MDIQELDRRAVELSTSIVATVTPDQLRLPTPCAEWDLGALLAHMTVQHHGFARAVAGERTEIADWHPTPIDDDPVGLYRKAADRVISSFAAAGALERMTYLPEIRDGVTVPGRVAMRFHFVDYVVHSWDVAVALGAEFEAADDMLDAGLVVAAQVPDDDASRQPGMAFGPKLELAEAPEGGKLDRLLTVLGRSPRWPN
ncbi:MAG TPA: TIGR03086 family metal-binding protein [Pseudonocardiaceae bacterium]|jgi:uncharacterized protein (TIGR03086 family)|nr:TIGR03086 family metal-binding protein [Pseudonocardiaceae bacterium]